MNMTKTLAAACMLAFVATASADPQLTSWLTKNSGQYARLYETTSAEAQGRVVTTWTNQSLPSYADIAEIASSANWVYIRYPDLASYNMGPWLTPGGGVFQFWPKNQHGLARFPRHPAQQTGTKTITGTGYSGNYVNGMAIFNALDGKAWDGGALVMGPHNKATYYWHRNAPVGESFNFDAGLGHQNPAGVYHTHQNPIALRFQLGDHVDFDSSNKAYSEDTNAPTRHSPIIGWSYDGYPIYGPYGYSSATDPDSGIRRMVSGYVQRDGTGGTDEVSTNRGVIPAWYARFRQAHFGGAYSTAAGTNRPAVNSTYPVGTFAEDFSYLGDVTNPATGEIYQQGTDFDLDVYNGRYCVTPEFPEGTYAYFVDIDDEGNSIYPYAFGFEFYGVASGSSGFASITEAVTTNFLGGADTPLALDAPSAQDSTVTLVWSSVDGGTYAVDSSTNGSDWSSEETGVASQGISTSTNYTSGGFRGTAYARVTRTALAEYDDVGGGSGTVNQSAVRSYQVANDSIAISINFTGTNDSSISSPMSSAEVAGVYQAANWNNSTNAASGDLNNVMDSLGTATSASISWAFDGVGVTAAANTAGDYRMMKGYLDVTNGSTGTITVSGLPSTISSGYDVLVYFDGANGSAGRVAQFKIGTAALFGKDNTIYYGVFVRSTNLTDNASATPYGNYVLFTNLSGSSFTLTATPGYASDGNPHAEVNGIQIISAAAGVTAVTTNPVSQVACQGSTAVFRAAAQSAATLSVQWKVKANGDDTFVDIPDATDTVLEVTAGASDDGNQYEAVFSSDLGDAATTPATLAVAPVPDATITSADASVVGGSTGNSARGPDGLASYGWTIQNGTITSATNLQTIAYTAGASGTVTLALTTTSAAGCEAAGSLNVPILTLTQGHIFLTNYDSVIQLATNVTRNYTFTDPANGLSVLIEVTLEPYSASNASPAFSLLDFADQTPTHMGINSGLSGGDGNWVDLFEGLNFSASLVSASSGIDTNSIEFGVTELGLRPNGDAIDLRWTSPATISSVMPREIALYPLDTALAPLASANYSAELRNLNVGAYQLNDAGTMAGQSIGFEAAFYEGTAPAASPTLSSVSLANGQIRFAVNGTTGDAYIVEASTNLWQPVWTPILTNASPFVYTETNGAAYPQRFYRAIAQ